jgi:hypothetical protein
VAEFGRGGEREGRVPRLEGIVTRMDANDSIFKQILDEPDFREVLSDYYLRKVYARIRAEDAA